MRKLRLLSKILLSLLLGLVLALAWFQFDERFITLANNGMEKIFEHQLNCSFKGTVKRLNLFTLTLDFTNVHVCPFGKNKQWTWSAKEMTTRLSFLEYLYYGMFGLHVKLVHVQSHSNLKPSGVPAVADHLTDLFAGANFSVPISFQTIGIEEGYLKIENKEEKTSFLCHWNSNAGKAGNDFKAKFYVSDTSFTKNRTTYFSNFRGQVTLDALHNNRILKIATDALVNLDQLPKGHQECYLFGSWNTNAGSFVLYNQERTFSFVPIEIALSKGTCIFNAEGVALVDHIKRFCFPQSTQELQGICCIKISGDLQNLLQASMRVHNFGYKDYVLDEIYANALRAGSTTRGSLGLRNNDACVSGVWQWMHDKNQGALQLLNKTTLPFFASRYWQSPPGHTALQAQLKHDGTGTVKYVSELVHKKTDQVIQSSGKVMYNNNSISVDGTLESNTYHAALTCFPFTLDLLEYKDAQNKTLIHAACTQKNKYTANLDYTLLQTLADDLLDVTLPGHGTFVTDFSIKYPYVCGELIFKDGSIRPEGVYNFVSDIATTFSADLERRISTFKDSVVKLHQGTITSSESTCYFNKDGSLYGMHSPWQFDNCFLHLGKYLYALCSGVAIVQGGSGMQNRVDGFCVFEKSQFKENILALQAQQNTFKSLPRKTMFDDLALNVAFSTHTPLLVRTSHLQTQASLDCTVQGLLSSPEFNGSLQLRGGKLIFPAKALSISKGKLTFMPGHTEDPSVELTAQARIKKYVITLSVNGTIKEPEILLQASPALSEQQILMLLLTGSEHESFNIMVPSLVMRNVESILFGPTKTLTHAPAAFSSWLKPLERVTFVPRFNDQSGQGGFKGAFEVEVSNRLRAVVEKDFSSAEDTAAEIEYLASDDVSFKLNRDERGDIGAEVEMRFKF